ncbi:MAG: hypothetical protein KF831_17585, partial [Acidobacteria bacterium]|nr:hypothetical protein [Acidobacteriota bacterium]
MHFICRVRRKTIERQESHGRCTNCPKARYLLFFLVTQLSENLIERTYLLMSISAKKTNSKADKKEANGGGGA